MIHTKKFWTADDLVTLVTHTDAEAARLMGRSIDSCRFKRAAMKKGSIPTVTASSAPETEPVEAPTLEQDRARASEDHWRVQHRELTRKYEAVLRENAELAEMSAVFRDLAPVSYSPLPAATFRRDDEESSPQSAVLMLSDTHVGQVIEPDQTLGFGHYNFEIFLRRLKFYEEAATSILRDHTNTPVPELVVCLGGDMIHGALQHSAEADQHVTLFEQFYSAGHAIAQFLRNLRRLVPAVRVYTTVGNHTRWQNQKKMPTVNRFSNMDQVLYAYIEALTADLKMEWHIDKQPAALFDVQGFRFMLTHGDELRGGDRALGIPNHAVGRLVSSKAQLFGKKGEASPHHYLVGHLHRGIVLPHARGSFLVNGGFPGVDGYGLANGFTPVDPKQLFFLVHPKFGKTATYEIELKFAREGGARPYVIPQLGGVS